ncbi:MAG: PDZ domain-containing protein [Gammaproteobacteria bacterium]|nr:PDZ domain-containing protein [Gammaproteobacteria bacterium]MDH3904859.1 PDZ domain-containing protein [Gammaproteobacteria bacterium]NCF60827.1 PDZ domain-containing protein [Gammaproteobacteria bacterium]
MHMNRTFLAIIFSLAAGFAAGAWTTVATPPSGSQGDSRHTAGAFDAAAPLEDRIAALEQAVSGERDARLVLEEQLHGLYAELERIDSPEMNELMRTLAETSQAREQARVQQAGRRDRGARMQDRKDMRVGQLVAGGFTEDRARQILEFEDETRMTALQAEYEARRNGETFNRWDWASDYQASLREQLGDADFEKYLTAQGGQASVTVREVIGASPANRAGLRPGDQILSYDGKRVFGMNDLKSMAFSGDPGEDVIVDIERNGQRMQLVLPRGPLGITGSGGGMGVRSPFGG